jgi:hypothetical protein
MSDQQQLAMNLLPPMSNAERALALHAGEEGGPWPLTAECKAVLGVLIYHKGAASAIQIKEISEYTKLSDRAVKDAVRSLIVDFRVRIAGSRQEPYGYYLVMTADEARAAAAPLIHEGIELFKRAGILTDKVFISEQQRADAHRDPEGGRVTTYFGRMQQNQVSQASTPVRRPNPRSLNEKVSRTRFAFNRCLDGRVPNLRRASRGRADGRHRPAVRS